MGPLCLVIILLLILINLGPNLYRLINPLLILLLSILLILCLEGFWPSDLTFCYHHGSNMTLRNLDIAKKIAGPYCLKIIEFCGKIWFFQVQKEPQNPHFQISMATLWKLKILTLRRYSLTPTDYPCLISLRSVERLCFVFHAHAYKLGKKWHKQTIYFKWPFTLNSWGGVLSIPSIQCTAGVPP